MKYVLLLLLAGCSSFKPYANAGITYALPFSSDHWINSEQPWQCEQPEFTAEVGAEHKSGVRIGVSHYSMVLCGSWNHKPEVYNNGIKISGDWGGWK